jgi:hypothetical protein
LISYHHEFFWNFSQFLAIYFELFSSGSKFNSENTDEWGPPISHRFPRRARLSVCRHRMAATHLHRTAPLAHLKCTVGTARRHPDSRPDRAAAVRAPPSPHLASHVLVPTAMSSVSEADRRCPSAPPSLSGHLRRRELVHGERSPSPFLPLFFRGTLSLAPSSSSPSQDCRRPPEPSPCQRTPPLIRLFSPSPSTRSSGGLSPPPPCPAGSLSTVGARA